MGIHQEISHLAGDSANMELGAERYASMETIYGNSKDGHLHCSSNI
jgi:hypothetical protein